MNANSDSSATGGLFKPSRLVTESIGFLIGLALLIWCISLAVRGGDWGKVLHADPLLVAGLVSCTLVSLAVNGAIFWLVVQPIAPLRFSHMQFLNLVSSVLNYAPIRAGLIARVAYHVRVDRLNLLQIGAWFAAVAWTLLLTLGAVVAATIVRPRFDWLWAAIIIGSLALGGLITWSAMGLPVVVRLGRGMDQMLRQPRGLCVAIGLRMIDVAAIAGRMACAAAILQLPLSGSNVLLLAIAAIALSLNPLGRIGYREAGVAFFAAYLGMSGTDFDAARSQLALVESAGEAIVAIPLGALALLWYRSRWKAARGKVTADERR